MKGFHIIALGFAYRLHPQVYLTANFNTTNGTVSIIVVSILEFVQS